MSSETKEETRIKALVEKKGATSGPINLIKCYAPLQPRGLFQFSPVLTAPKQWTIKDVLAARLLQLQLVKQLEKANQPVNLADSNYIKWFQLSLWSKFDLKPQVTKNATKQQPNLNIHYAIKSTIADSDPFAGYFHSEDFPAKDDTMLHNQSSS